MRNTITKTIHIENAITAFAQNCQKEFEDLHLTNMSDMREKALINLYQKRNNANAFNRVFFHNYKYIMTLTYLWKGSHINQHEILSACIDGLIKAISTYNTDKCKFNTYAIKTMRREIRKVTALLGTAITFNEMAYRRIRFVDKCINNGMTISEIAEKMKCTPKQVRIYASYAFSSLNNNNKIDDTEYTSTNEMYDHLEYLVENHLSGLESKIIRNRFGLRCKPKKLNEISEKFGIEYTKVKRTYASAMIKLKSLA